MAVYATSSWDSANRRVAGGRIVRNILERRQPIRIGVVCLAGSLVYVSPLL